MRRSDDKRRALYHRPKLTSKYFYIDLLTASDFESGKLLRQWRAFAASGCSSMVLDSKLPHVGTTIFTVMSKLAADHGAINLSQGFPDFDGPTALLERAVYHLTHGHNQYAPMPGVMALREQVARKVASLYGASVDPDAEVTITAGATEAIFCAITAVVRAGDEVIVFDPAYDCYEPTVTLAGGVTRHVPLVAPSFTPDWDRVRDALTKRTRLLIINTPHNPTGSIWREADLQALRELARDHDFFIVGDEVYEHIVFDGDRHESLLRVSGSVRAQLRRVVVRQDVSRNRLEDRLLRGPEGTDRRTAAHPSIREFRREHADPARAGRLHGDCAGTRHVTRRVLSEETRSVRRACSNRRASASRRVPEPISSCSTTVACRTKPTSTCRGG